LLAADANEYRSSELALPWLFLLAKARIYECLLFESKSQL